LRTHASSDVFVRSVAPRRVFGVSTRGTVRYDQVRYADDDALLFGSETSGLPQGLLEGLPAECRLRLPMRAGNRSLNLSNAVAVLVYEAWRQLDFAGAQAPTTAAPD
jgi:tRNA (cytidine/uridine-2'-O-)-methyltransferase